MAIKLCAFLSILIVLLSFAANAAAVVPQECDSKGEEGCHDKSQALKLKVIAISSILAASLIGVCLPIFSRTVPALQPDKNLFASGVILATGTCMCCPIDSFDCLRSECLPETPWRKFPFTTFVAMLSAVLTLMVDSFSMTYFKKRFLRPLAACQDEENAKNGDHIKSQEGLNDKDSKLLRHRVVAQVLELGIVVHSVVIGLSMGASNNPCTIKPLIAALCFHQLFEGMGLGGCILQLAEYGIKMKAVMMFFFSTTTPFGIALGIALSDVYSDNSPTALIVVGLLNASSAGLLNYMALVDLLASDFMGPKLQGSVKLQIWSYIAVLLGAGSMSLMAKWA